MESQIPQEKSKSPVGKGEVWGEIEEETATERKREPLKDVSTKQQSILVHVEQGK